jgi:hypothetical protein
VPDWLLLVCCFWGFLPASQDAGNRIGHDTILLDAFVEFMKLNLCDSDFGILILDPDLEP